jgi:FkbH-like protein
MSESKAILGPERSPAEQAANAKAIWRRYSEQVRQGAITPSLRVGLAASFTANSLLPFVGAPLVENGESPALELGPYNQIFQVCYDYKGILGKGCDVIVLLWRLEDIALEEMLAFLNGDASAIQRAAEKVEMLGTALAKLRESFPGSLLVNLPPYPAALPAFTLSLDNPLGLGALHRALTTRFVDQAGKIRGLRLVDLDAAQRDCGLNRAFDSRQYYLYRQPFTDEFLLRAGRLIGRIILALRRAPQKCIVLDCDNTLWGGIVGEDGVAGIQLGDEFPGTAFRDFQRWLLYWRRQGVFLAISSKNNEADVWEVFAKHDGMVLKREDISAWQINWEPKAEKIPLIAKALNIGTDSLVFIDDNPMEIEYVRSALPEVISVQVPEDPADILATMRALTCFDRLEVTDEDRQRADMMRAEQSREALGASLSKDEFRKSLGLKLDFFPGHAELERITQLINKTNQFNLTTKRRTLDEVRALAQSPQHRIYGLRVSDKFGDYGLTGVVVAEISQDRSHWFIDTFLLSCRVLGRGTETALLAALAEAARAESASALFATFIPSAKNAPAASFLSDHGFAVHDENWWRVDLAQVPEVCSSITLIRSSAGTAS